MRKIRLYALLLIFLAAIGTFFSLKNIRSRITSGATRSRRLWLTVLFTVSAAFLVFFLIFLGTYALDRGLDINTYPTDGTFQLYNPLRRIELGQVIARDFPVFHGVGVPLLHYPVFWLFGHNLFAAEVAKWSVSAILFVLSTVVFFYSLFKDYKKTVIASALIGALSLYGLNGAVFPGNSLLSVRTTVPLLIAAVLLWKDGRRVRLYRYDAALKSIVLIVLLSLSVTIGTEQGLAAIASYLLVRLYVRVRRHRKRKAVILTFVEGVVVGALAFALISIMTLGHAADALRYALVDVPADQGWYFGGPPNLYLSVGNILKSIASFDFAVPLLVLVPCGIIIFLTVRKRILTSTYASLAYVSLYGLISFAVSSTGYFNPSSHLFPLMRGVALFAIGYIVWWIYTGSAARRLYRIVLISTVGISITLLSVLSVSLVGKLHEMKPVETLLRSKLARHQADTTTLSHEWHRDVDRILSRIPQNASIWSTYTSVIDSSHGQLNRSQGGEDYIIHALGSQHRDQYVASFARDNPDYVVTMRPSFFPYEEWLWNENWPFYRYLFENYSVDTISDWHVLWKRRPTLPQTDGPHDMIQQNNQWKLPVNDSGHIRLYEVSVEYDASPNLPTGYLKKFPRYLLSINNNTVTTCPISLPPLQKTYEFPVILSAHNDKATITPHANGIVPFESLIVKHMTYREISTDAANQTVFLDNAKRAHITYQHYDTCNQ